MRRNLLFAILTLTVAMPVFAADDWGLYFERLRVDEALHRLSKKAAPVDLAFVGVDVVPMTPGTPFLRDQTVIVRGGLIDRAGPRASTAVPSGMRRVDGRGKYLFPGLTDAHVHTLKTNGDLLLDLINGVTTIREMDGFPWLLRMRDAARANRLLAPTSYVAGQILNGAPMGWYAVVIKTPEQARQVVHEQKAAGYDYIKIHNFMPLPIYDAIAAAAREEHIRLIGHIPHQVSVAHALESGQFTFEHFKGFYLDSNLTMSPEPWLAEIKSADVWLCPTLVTWMASFSVEETKRFIASPDAQYFSLRSRRTWPQAVTEQDAKSMGTVWQLTQPIFKQLLPVTDRFIAGTDSGGGYANSIRGFALHDEVETFESLGMPTAEALRTVTVNSSIALGDPRSFGTIEPGKRADLLLLDRNPLETVRNLRALRGVMLRGIWLDRASLDGIGNELKTIYARSGADTSLDDPSPKQIDTLLAGLSALIADGAILNDHALGVLATMLRVKGRDADADRVAGWETK
jgi:Amidohydrolase family